MSRKEEIEKAAWCNYPLIKGGEEQFIQGAEWADRTFLNSLWHDVSREPDFSKTIIFIQSKNKELCVLLPNMQSLWNSSWVDKWCYLDDILPDDK